MTTYNVCITPRDWGPRRAPGSTTGSSIDLVDQKNLSFYCIFRPQSELTAGSPNKWMKMVLGESPEWIHVRPSFGSGSTLTKAMHHVTKSRKMLKKSSHGYCIYDKAVKGRRSETCQSTGSLQRLNSVFPKVTQITAPNHETVQAKLPADPHATVCTTVSHVTSGKTELEEKCKSQAKAETGQKTRRLEPCPATQ